jgi:hypothetical protein
MTPSPPVSMPPFSMPPLDILKIWQFPENSEQAGLIKKCIALEALSTDESCETVAKLIVVLKVSLTTTLPDVRWKLQIFLNQLQVKVKQPKPTDIGVNKEPCPYPHLDDIRHARNKLSFSVGGLLRGLRDWVAVYPGEGSIKVLEEYAQVAVRELKRLEAAHRRFFKRASQRMNDEVRVLYWLTEAYGERGELASSPELRTWHQLFAIGTRKISNPDVIEGHRWDPYLDSSPTAFDLTSTAMIKESKRSCFHYVLSDPPSSHRVPVPVSIILQSDVKGAVEACEDLQCCHMECRVICFKFLMQMSNMGVLLNHNAGWLAYQHLVYRNYTWVGIHSRSFEPAKFLETLRLREMQEAWIKARQAGKVMKVRDEQSVKNRTRPG